MTNISTIVLYHIHITYISEILLISNSDDEKISFSEGEVRITSEATVKLPKNIKDAISPDLNKLPDTANCSTMFKTIQVKIYIVLEF